MLTNSGIQHSLIISREGSILTLAILPVLGWIFWSIPRDKIDDKKMSVLHQSWGGIGKSIPEGKLLCLGISLGHRGCISPYLLRLSRARIHYCHVRSWPLLTKTSSFIWPIGGKCKPILAHNMSWICPTDIMTLTSRHWWRMRGGGRKEAVNWRTAGNTWVGRSQCTLHYV